LAQTPEDLQELHLPLATATVSVGDQGAMLDQLVHLVVEVVEVVPLCCCKMVAWLVLRPAAAVVLVQVDSVVAVTHLAAPAKPIQDITDKMAKVIQVMVVAVAEVVVAGMALLLQEEVVATVGVRDQEIVPDSRVPMD
jgi:hypothetical protein